MGPPCKAVPLGEPLEPLVPFRVCCNIFCSRVGVGGELVGGDRSELPATIPGEERIIEPEGRLVPSGLVSHPSTAFANWGKTKEERDKVINTSHCKETNMFALSMANVNTCCE